MPFRALIELVKESTNSFVFDLSKKSRSHAYKNKFRKYAITNIHQLDDMNIYVRLSMSTNPITNNSITHEINTTIDENILEQHLRQNTKTIQLRRLFHCSTRNLKTTCFNVYVVRQNMHSDLDGPFFDKATINASMTNHFQDNSSDLFFGLLIQFY